MPYPSFCIHESQEPDIVFVMYTLLRTTHIVPENLNLNICVNTQNKSNMKHADSRKSSKESYKNKNGIDLYFWKYIKYQKL